MWGDEIITTEKAILIFLATLFESENDKFLQKKKKKRSACISELY